MTKDNRPPTLRDWLGFTAPLDFTKARTLGGVLGAILTLIALTFAALFFLSLAAAGSLVLNVLTSEPDTASLGLGALLVALLGAPFLIWRTVVAQRTLDETKRQTDLQAEAHFNDKINAAATDLAARRQVTRVVKDEGGKETVLTEWQDDLVTRAAAIDRLEGLALEALERGDYAPAQRIARMLSIYVQELSREHPPKPAPKFDSAKQIREWASTLRPVARPDMERAAQSLGRINPRDETVRAVFDPTNIDLRDCNLQGFDLDGSNYRGSRMKRADLCGAFLEETQIQRADFCDSRLMGAYLARAEMEGADFQRAELQGTVLVDAQMQETVFFNSKLQQADLRRAVLHGASLIGAELERANLYGSKMQGAHLIGAQMQGVDLGQVEMSENTITNAANLQGAAIALVDNITISQLRSHWPRMIAFLESLPEGAPEHWMQLTVEDFSFAAFNRDWRAWAATLDPPVTIAPDNYRD
ncbi:pentapeptide repeat-containing protein [Roseicyclus amphidinii]|uniref:pentapeptide repeat-containing protein n=1 Tax=Roseicyclus amphidinii TaxID=3034232 RepID=UPI0024E158F0|nr:pentapeptide repeat-containing protein [Roseicyclus sp. Amp-Y-6]